MDQFMLIFHGGSDQVTFPSAEAMQAHMGKWLAWVDKLKKGGQYVSGEPLIPGGKLVSAKTVIDGPYTEGKEVVGGYFVVKAKTIDEAVALAQKDYPDFEFGGTVQVRQVMNVDDL